VEEPAAPVQPTVEETDPPAAPATADTPEAAPTEVTEATQAPEQPAAPANTTSSGSAIDDIIAASLALREQRYFRMESELIYDNYTEFTEIQVAPPDRMRIIGEDYELRVVEGRMFVSDNTGWMEMPIMAGALENMIFMLADEEIEEMRSSTTRAEYLGEEELDGERTRTYLLEMYDEETDSQGEVKLWIAVSDGLFRRFETIDPDEDGARIVNTYKDYNVPLTIELPELE
jgi:outer membrane lipoprotein-sorting protein